MSILSTIEKPADRPVIITIAGSAGLGKTSLASAFPSPIFIRAEDGLQAIPKDKRPPAFPLLQKPQQLWDELTALYKEKHEFKTLVIDSVTQLDTLFSTHIMETDVNKPRSMAQALGGYGAGFQALSAMHGRVRKAAGILNEKLGMHVVFIAHADTETIELPDIDPYTTYTIRMQKKSVSHYIDNVDMVAHLRLETFLKGADGERKKAISDGTRVAVCHAVASCVSKNRFGITEPITVQPGINPFIDLIPSLGEQQ